MEIQFIGMIIFFVVVIAVGIAIVTSFASLKNMLPSQFKDVYNKVVAALGFKSPFNICESFLGQKISLQDFQTLLQAIYNGQCGSSHTNVSLSFSLAKADLEKIAILDGIALGGKLIFYNISSPLGVGAIIVQGDPGPYPLKFEDFVDMSRVGSPVGDVFIKVTLKGCDPYDDICDATCIFKKICDPVCDDGNKHNIPCNLACIDTNGNNTVDMQDAQQRISQNKCNPDCYVNYTNPFKAYDPGCVWKFRNQTDDVCDPNSNGVYDGICDSDCVKTKNICDPDCNGTFYEGNPYKLNDTKCFVCDGTCNGWCSPSCKKNAFSGDPKFDPDCFRTINASFYCSGDGLCESDRGESCANSADCPGGGLTCGDYHDVCCPSASDADVSGCSITTNVSESGSCSCGTQCAANMTCSINHCCPSGKAWNGTACAASGDVLIVALKSRLKTVYSDSQISQLENKIGDYIKSLSNDGLSGTFIYLDDDQVLNYIPNKVTNAGDWNNIDGILAQLLPKTKAKYLLIIGGSHSFPQPEVSVGACSDPFYSTFQTDDVYADYTNDYIPEVPVGRIPDPNGGDIDVLLNALNTYINLHNSGGLDLSDKFSIIMEHAFSGCPKASTGICFNKDAFNTNCFSSICHDSSTSYTALGGHKLVNVLMHGDYVTPQPFIDDPCNTGRLFMTATQVPSLNVQNSVWLMMPCYSAFLKNKQQSSDSVPIQFLKSGGAVYFGGTLTQMGGTMNGNNCPAVPGGDYAIGTLYTLTVNQFSAGNTIGKAYLAAKTAYSNMRSGDSDTDSCIFRQSHENQMYGDPTLKIKNV